MRCANASCTPCTLHIVISQEACAETNSPSARGLKVLTINALSISRSFSPGSLGLKASSLLSSISAAFQACAGIECIDGITLGSTLPIPRPLGNWKKRQILLIRWPMYSPSARGSGPLLSSPQATAANTSPAAATNAKGKMRIVMLLGAVPRSRKTDRAVRTD